VSNIPTLPLQETLRLGKMSGKFVIPVQKVANE
jgi:hypothetical protein